MRLFFSPSRLLCLPLLGTRYRYLTSTGTLLLFGTNLRGYKQYTTSIYTIIISMDPSARTCTGSGTSSRTCSSTDHEDDNNVTITDRQPLSSFDDGSSGHSNNPMHPHHPHHHHHRHRQSASCEDYDNAGMHHFSLEEDDDGNPPRMHVLNITRQRRRRRRPVWCSRWILPKPFLLLKYYDDPSIPIEATGSSVDMFARAVIFMATIFLGPGLLELATRQAVDDCPSYFEDGINDECRVYGFKPSSLLSNIAMVAGFLSTLVLPISGAIVDHTHYRRAVGAWTAGGLVLIKLVEFILLGGRWSSSTWFVVACFQVVSGVLYQLHVAAVYAYSAELTQTPTLQSGYQTHFFFCMYVSMLWYVVQVLVVGHYWNKEKDDVETARLGLVITTIWSAPLFFLAWKYLFQECGPIAYLAEGQSLWTVGFSKLYHTSRTLFVANTTAPDHHDHEHHHDHNDHNEQLSPPPQCGCGGGGHRCRRRRHPAGIFLAGIMFSEAADTALPTIATTYMSEFLGMDASEIGQTILFNLIAGIPGTWLGHFICQRYNSPVVSAKAAILLYMTTTAVASVVLKETTKQYVYLFGMLWGICQGWMHPQHTTIFVTIVPPTMEMMSVFLFATQVLVFLPPLVFTVLNEVGNIPMNWGLASLVIYFGLGYLGLVGMGDYQQATMTMKNHHPNPNPSPMQESSWGEESQPAVVATTTMSTVAEVL